MQLARFVFIRCIQAFFLLLGVVTLVFFLSRLLPGDPASLVLSPSVPRGVAAQLRTEFGLDEPVLHQYIAWLGAALRGNFGFSFAAGEPVRAILLRVFPNTLLLGLSALALELCAAAFLAGLAARHAGSLIDRLISQGSLFVYALPTFWIGILLLIVFSFGLGLFPSSQMHSTRFVSGSGGLADLLWHLCLPAVTAAIPGAANLARYLRTSIGDTLHQEFVLAARSMGIPDGRVIRSYVLPNSAGPLITQAGLETGILLSGVVVTETLFAWPGMGRTLVMAILARDYPLIIGCALLSGGVVILGNLLADVAQAIIDPRVTLRQ